ncbi:hypothetical protein QOZ80_3BG0284210 [Eleusine coracana subsp. coracana]|nr:hypothetical protein QOZ80_3BG0284210 [Eleusine coracana subsp. coracana]
MALSCGSSAAYGFGRRSARRRSPSFDGDFGLENLFQKQFESEEDHVNIQIGSGSFFELDPSLWDVFVLDLNDDEEETTAAEEAERLKLEMEEKKREAEEKKRKEESVRSQKKHDAVIKLIRKYDPKAKNLVWTRFPFEQFSLFDLDEESPVPPMRHSTRKYQAEDQIELFMFCSANILSIKIASSDVGYPINVYGTVIARDSLDHKCIYLFRCDRRHSQLIKSEDKSLILIGPSRGLLLQDFIFLEVDLKIKGERGQDKLLFRRLLEIDGRVVTRQNIELAMVRLQPQRGKLVLRLNSMMLMKRNSFVVGLSFK